MTEKNIQDKNMKEFNHIREGLWTFVLPSYFTNQDNPRIDCYQNTKENRVIMMALMDIHLRLKDIEEFIEDRKEKSQTKQKP